MANAIFFSNIAQQTTLSGSISAGATTITVGATTGFPGSFPYVLSLDYGATTEELVLVTAAAGTNLTITRAYGGTSAQSHSLGAVVRHVYDATEATAFRTHEAATSDVHGVTGALVGATQTQTLTNKTLTSPTINSGTYASGGSFAGTFTGTPTFSGAVAFSGNPNFTGTPTFGASSHSGTATHTGLVQSSRTNSTDVALAAIANGDTFDRFRAYVSGLHEWGPGNAARDTNLYRSAADELKTDDALRVAGVLNLDNQALLARSSTSSAAYTARVTGDTDYRFYMDAGGTLQWGSGSAAADVNLYRQAANTLQTDDSFYAANLTDWTAYTPTWAGMTSQGTSPTINGRWRRSGNEVSVIAHITAGTSPSLGTGTITVSLPFTASSTPTGNTGWQGTGRHVGNDGSTFKTLIPMVNPGATTATVFGLRQSDAGWTSPGTAGFVWIAGSSMRVQFSYEV